MVLDLEIQSPDKPGDDLIARGEVGCRLDLVNGPFLFQLLCIVLRNMDEFHVFHYMRQLEYDGQGQSHDHLHGAIPDGPDLPSYQTSRYQDIKDGIQCLAKPEYDIFDDAHFLQRGGDDLSFKIFIEIHHRDPGDGGDRIDQHYIKMLEAVSGDPFLRGALPHQGTFGDIIVDPIHIGIGMMDDIVLELPYKGITAQCIEGKSHQVVDPAFGGIAAVTGVMHDIESRAGEHKSQDRATADPREGRQKGKMRQRGRLAEIEH